MPTIWTYQRNSATYAELRSSKRISGTEAPVSNVVYLGQVIDLERGIFKNRERGIYKYTIDAGFEETDMQDTTLLAAYQNEKLIVDFGASYLLAQFAKNTGFWDVVRQTLPGRENTLMAMLFYYIEVAASNQDAERWLRGSFSSLLFPSAQLQSQRISEFLAKLGDEAVAQDFFVRYIKLQWPQGTKAAILIDSTGLPNAIHFPLTAVSTHGGETTEETRLIYVVDAKSGMPLFFRYNAGNIVDVSTLKSTLDELKANGVSVKDAIVDAGYCSEKNIDELYRAKIQFLTRIPTNRTLYRDMLANHGADALADECRYMYQDRMVGIKRIYTTLFGHRAYVYVCIDYNTRNDQIMHFTKGAISDKTPRKKWGAHTKDMGFFELVSSRKIEPEDLLPLYYTRQTVEQVFDVCKNNIKMLPLRVHSEETFRGHILLSFMAVSLYLALNHRFKGHKTFTAQNALMEMRNLKCKVYDKHLLVKEPTKDMKQIAKLVGIKIPDKLILSDVKMTV